MLLKNKLECFCNDNFLLQSNVCGKATRLLWLWFPIEGLYNGEKDLQARSYYLTAVYYYDKSAGSSICKVFLPWISKFGYGRVLQNDVGRENWNKQKQSKVE